MAMPTSLQQRQSPAGATITATTKTITKPYVVTKTNSGTVVYTYGSYAIFEPIWKLTQTKPLGTPRIAGVTPMASYVAIKKDEKFGIRLSGSCGMLEQDNKSWNATVLTKETQRSAKSSMSFAGCVLTWRCDDDADYKKVKFTSWDVFATYWDAFNRNEFGACGVLEEKRSCYVQSDYCYEDGVTQHGCNQKNENIHDT
ncbi:hypothetical protein N7492_007931 [Penicillium capsulatum]|uniref:Uncharacterized protein n=1 Tax=Penicillium capsulatum TaxID=69766 RepID=A0A9W9I0T6_9EURO|nr:hypothetical protein N7492_007931 [Penicillium capsulatum]KAJ6117760.1 hypothetical protein N7512_007485 [Penicillium capsulatum]